MYPTKQKSAKHRHFTVQEMREMRQWLEDCLEDCQDAENLTDYQVVRAVQRYYAGGIKQFVREGKVSHG
jgi:hypothetical protein